MFILHKKTTDHDYLQKDNKYDNIMNNCNFIVK